MTLSAGARALEEGEDNDRDGHGLSSLYVGAGAASHRWPPSLRNLGRGVGAGGWVSLYKRIVIKEALPESHPDTDFPCISLVEPPAIRASFEPITGKDADRHCHTLTVVLDLPDTETL